MTRLLADENVPAEAVEALKRKGVDIISVTAISLGLNDEKVLDIAIKENTLPQDTILKTVTLKPVQVHSEKQKWGRETSLDAGSATFGEYKKCVDVLKKAYLRSKRECS